LLVAEVVELEMHDLSHQQPVTSNITYLSFSEGAAESLRIPCGSSGLAADPIRPSSELHNAFCAAGLHETFTPSARPLLPALVVSKMDMSTMTVDAYNGPKAFEGDVAELPVPELLQFIHISGKDGVLVVTDVTGRPRAVIHYAQSSIVHATCDGIVGREAVFAAVAFSSGRFEFFTGKAAHIDRTIDDNVQNLILEGLRRLDELSHVASLLPKDHEPLFVAPEPPHDDIRLTAKEWRILSLVNGKRSVRQIIDTSARDESEVRAVLVGLLAADLIVDRRDDSYLDAIVPRHLPQSEVGTTRYAPPTLVGNLLLKSCDGRRTARQLMADMRMDERQLLEELKLLARTQWIAFAAGGEVFHRLAQE
jgi:uncharacterized protein DUF4388